MSISAFRPHPLARLTVALVVSCLASGLAGCGRSATNAEVKALSTQFTASKGPVGVPETAKQRECRARVMLEADLSDEARDALKKSGVLTPHDKHDREVLRDIADDLAKCV